MHAKPTATSPQGRSARFTLPFQVAIAFVVISMLLSVMGIGYAAYYSEDADNAFRVGLSIALGFITGGAVGLYLLVDHYLERIHVVEQERLGALETLRQAEQSMLRADGVAAMAAGITHEFNNLIMPFSMGLEHLGRVVGDPAAKVVVSRMEANMTQAAALVRQLSALGHAAGAGGPRERIDPGPMVQAFADSIRPAMGAHIKVGVAVAAGVGPLMVEAERFVRVLHTLVENARDAIGERPGEITFRVEPRRHLDRDWVSITVSDTGCGMTPEAVTQVFTPFYTTKSRGRGTGLSLPTARRVITSHGGSIQVSSTQGRGTDVTLLRPAAPGSAGA
jgi:signal transduction histidine kinase